MSPWEELKYFYTPVMRNVIMTSLSQTTINSDPYRVWLMFSSPDSVILAVRPDVGQVNAAQQIGFNLYNAVPPLIFRAKDDPWLCQSAWRVNNPGSITVQFSWMEITMVRWPTLPPLEQASRGKILAPEIEIGG